jgi:hypothetical protein
MTMGRPPSLDGALVARVLAEERFSFSRAARRLGISTTDLRAYVFAPQRKVLAQVHDEVDLAIMPARGRLIRAIYSNNHRRREWAAEWMLSNWGYRADDPFPPK